MGNLANLQRLPTVRKDRSAIERECRAAWHLANDGSWLELHGATDIEVRWEQVANGLAASCFGLDVGGRLVAESGNVTIVASRKHDGVWVGLRDQRGNPITLVSALHRIETRVRSQVDLPPVKPQHDTRPLKLEDSEIIEGPNLIDTITYLNTITDMTGRHIDRATLFDFWSRSLGDSPLAGIIAFSSEDGFRVPSSNRGLTAVEIDMLDEAFAGWKLRVRMALGTIYSKIPLLKTPVWR
jgi:hypothetical protein